MLVLGRKTNDSVMIGENIVVRILAIDGDKVKIGIEAPADVPILRHELYETIKQENLRAAHLATHTDMKLLPSVRQLLKKKREEVVPES